MVLREDRLGLEVDQQDQEEADQSQLKRMVRVNPCVRIRTRKGMVCLGKKLWITHKSFIATTYLDPVVANEKRKGV